MSGTSGLIDLLPARESRMLPIMQLRNLRGGEKPSFRSKKGRGYMGRDLWVGSTASGEYRVLAYHASSNFCVVDVTLVH